VYGRGYASQCAALALLLCISAAAWAQADAAPAPTDTDEAAQRARLTAEPGAQLRALDALIAARRWTQAYAASKPLQEVLDVSAQRRAMVAALAVKAYADAELLAERLITRDVLREDGTGPSQGDVLAWALSVHGQADRGGLAWARRVLATEASAADLDALLGRLTAESAPDPARIIAEVQSREKAVVPRAVAQSALRLRAFVPAAEVKIGTRAWKVGYARQGLIAYDGQELRPLSVHGVADYIDTDWAPDVRIKAGRPKLGGAAQFDSVLEYLGPPDIATPQSQSVHCNLSFSPVTVEEYCSSAYDGGVHPDVSASSARFSLRPDHPFEEMAKSCAGASYDPAEFRRSFEAVVTACEEYLAENYAAMEGRSTTQASEQNRAAAHQEARDLLGEPVCQDIAYIDGRWHVTGMTYPPRVARETECDLQIYSAPILDQSKFQKWLLTSPEPFAPAAPTGRP